MSHSLNKKAHYIFDSLLVLINVSNSYSILPYLIFSQYYRGINSVIIASLSLVYMAYRFKGKIDLNITSKLFYIFITINLTNVFFGLITDSYGWGTFPFIFSNMIFYILLHNLFKDYQKKLSFERSVNLLLRGYIWLCIVGISSMITIYVLIAFFDMFPLQNLANHEMDLFLGNSERNANVNYYFPYYLGIVHQTPAIKIPFFQEYGIITGLYHEGQLSAFLLTPSFFIVISIIKKTPYRILILFVYLLAMLLVASTTNILSMGACLMMFLIVEFRRRIFIPIILLVVVGMIFIFINPDQYQFIFDKIASRSADYSMSTLTYAFTPETLIGNNFYNLSYWDDPSSELNIGFVNFFLNISFLVILVYKIILINFSKKIEIRLLGLFLLYVFLHSIKINLFVYTLSYFILCIFLIEVLSKKKQKQ